MKKFGIIAAIVLGSMLPGLPAFGHENEDEGNNDYRSVRHEGLDREVNHLNRMLARVRWQLGTYRADRHVRREFWHISREVDDLNRKFAQRFYDRRHLRGEVEHIHGELHHIEDELHVRRNDIYEWR